MHEPPERVEPHDAPAGISALQLHLAADQVERHQDHEHCDDRDAADPAQRHLMELAPVAPGWMDQVSRLLIRNADTPADGAAGPERIEQLLLLDRLRGRFDRLRLLLTLWKCDRE